MIHKIEIMISEKELNNRIIELGNSISSYYSSSSNKILLVGLLRGSFVFIADLCRALNIEHNVDFMTVSSYNNDIISSDNIKIVKDLDEDVCGKDVLIIEDIIDSGSTLNKVRQMLTMRKPNSIAICTLLDKPCRRKVNIAAKWIGFIIPNEFVVGYGIDYAQDYRHLPYIGKLNICK